MEVGVGGGGSSVTDELLSEAEDYMATHQQSRGVSNASRGGKQRIYGTDAQTDLRHPCQKNLGKHRYSCNKYSDSDSVQLYCQVPIQLR